MSDVRVLFNFDLSVYAKQASNNRPLDLVVQQIVGAEDLLGTMNEGTKPCYFLKPWSKAGIMRILSGMG